METQNLPEQTIPSADGDATSHIEVLRQRAREKLGDIRTEATTALSEIDINYPVFIFISQRDGAMFYVGTAEDPPDDEWNLISDTVSRVVEGIIGSGRAAATEITCTQLTPDDTIGGNHANL